MTIFNFAIFFVVLLLHILSLYSGRLNKSKSILTCVVCVHVLSLPCLSFHCIACPFIALPVLSLHCLSFYNFWSPHWYLQRQCNERTGSVMKGQAMQWKDRQGNERTGIEIKGQATQRTGIFKTFLMLHNEVFFLYIWMVGSGRI
jgi:hypothetical protein